MICLKQVGDGLEDLIGSGELFVVDVTVGEVVGDEEENVEGI